MGPERKHNLRSSDPRQRAEQDRAELYAAARRLIAEGVALRKRAEELVRKADELMATFKREHPEK